MKVDLTFYDQGDSKNRLVVDGIDLDEVPRKVRAAQAVGFTHARLWFAGYARKEDESDA